MKNQHAGGPDKKTEVKPADADFKSGCFGLVLRDHDVNRSDPDTQDEDAAKGMIHEREHPFRQPF